MAPITRLEPSFYTRSLALVVRVAHPDRSLGTLSCDTQFVSTSPPGEAHFPSDVDEHVRLIAHDEAFFGRDVLRGLVAGLREAASRPRSERWWGPGVLGCAMWMDDPELIDVLGAMANVCIVITKQSQRNLAKDKASPLRELAASFGLAHEAYPELAEFAPHNEGRPLIVGPGTPNWSEATEIRAVREVGFRKVGDRLVPLVHAKIALLGSMHWTDEHPSGYPVDELSFVPERLWIGSANFTLSSRAGLEMGLWTSDRELMGAARRFLLGLVTISEPLGAGPDTMAPELVPVAYDDEAIMEYFRTQRAEEDDDYW